MAGLNGTSLNGAATTVVSGTPALKVYDCMQEDPMNEVEAERIRLEGDIAAARARIAVARARAESREVQTRASLHEELLAARERLVEMEREHERLAAEVRAVAAAEVERILAEARQHQDVVSDAG